MKKSDLQNGMIVECENGQRYMVVRNFNEYTNIFSGGTRDVFLGIYEDGGYMRFSDYGEDLKLNHKDILGYSIAKVGYPKGLGSHIGANANIVWIWERKKVTLTDDEIVILKNIDKSWAYIAREKSGELCLATDNMRKFYYCWDTDGFMDSLHWFNHLFQFIKWEDEEPYDIDDLLKRNGVER